eukprot:gene42722-52202_t
MFIAVARNSPFRQQLGYLVSWRSFVKVGDAVPVNFMKDEKPPLVKEDKEYPEWLKTIGKKLPTKQELMAKLEQDGVTSLSLEEARRLKRLITLEQIKTYNLSQVAEKSG